MLVVLLDDIDVALYINGELAYVPASVLNTGYAEVVNSRSPLREQRTLDMSFNCAVRTVDRAIGRDFVSSAWYPSSEALAPTARASSREHDAIAAADVLLSL